MPCHCGVGIQYHRTTCSQAFILVHTPCQPRPDARTHCDFRCYCLLCMPNGQCSCYAPRPPRYGEFWGGLAGGPFCEFSRCIRLAAAGGRSASTLFVSQTEPGDSKAVMPGVWKILREFHGPAHENFRKL